MKVQFQLTGAEMQEFVIANAHLSASQSALLSKRWAQFILLTDLLIIIVSALANPLNYHTLDQVELSALSRFGYALLGSVGLLFAYIFLVILLFTKKVIRYTFAPKPASSVVISLGHYIGFAIITVSALACCIFNVIAPKISSGSETISNPDSSAFAFAVRVLKNTSLSCGFPMFVVFVICLQSRRTIQKKYHTETEKLGFQSWDITPDHLSITTNSSNGENKWYAYEFYCESPKLFVLYIKANTANILPKRAFMSEAQIAEFRSLAQTKLSPPTYAFPICTSPPSSPTSST